MLYLPLSRMHFQSLLCSLLLPTLVPCVKFHEEFPAHASRSPAWSSQNLAEVDVGSMVQFSSRKPGGGHPDPSATKTAVRANQTVTFHWSLFEQDGFGWEESFFDQLETLNFCFNEIMVTVDVKHGGKNYGPSYLPHPPGGLNSGAQDFRASERGKQFLDRAKAVVHSAKSQLQIKCPGTDVSASVHLLDYADPLVLSTLRQIFDVDGATSVSYSAWRETYLPDGTEHYPFARMWKNSFMYMYAFTLAKSQALFHLDADVPAMLPNIVPGGSNLHEKGNFIASGLASLEAHPDVVMVMPPRCQTTVDPSGKQFAVPNCEKGCRLLGDDLLVVERSVPDEMHPLVTYVSMQHFLSDVQRMKSMWPLSYWTDMLEVMLMQHFADKGMKSAYSDKHLSNVCFPA
eukprot:TRINITY_DN60854_c0_g1_i1.p1 TRINITY_DN60854_c0_g1~~TRINITY_DN60854_c0_g1_i1.p1  ORF type:complete len:401 (+),score=41.17 TRINITY_DN60854_c0_g1_i1:61-1263(+)